MDKAKCVQLLFSLSLFEKEKQIELKKQLDK